MFHENLPLSVRLAVPISDDALYDLRNYYNKTGFWLWARPILWDIKRLFPDDPQWVLEFTDEPIPSDLPCDVLVIDQLDEIEARGWSVPDDIAYNLETLRLLRALYDAVDATERAAETFWKEWIDPLERVERNLMRPLWNAVETTERVATVLSEQLTLLHAELIDTLKWSNVMNEVESAVELRVPLLTEEVERSLMNFNTMRVNERTNAPLNDNADNVRVFLGIIQVELRWNAWTERVEMKGFFDRLDGPNTVFKYPEWTVLDDTIIAQLRTRAAWTHMNFHPAVDFLLSAIVDLAHRNVFDPVLDELSYMEALWDGQPRLSTWLHHACGTSDDAYHGAVGRLIVMGIVFRARRPGCKFDFLPTFLGPQGVGKSLLARKLALNDEWFSDNVKLADESKELILSLAGVLVAEISELSGSKRDRDLVKSMLSRQTDRGRTAYARTVSDRPRRNIFIGTGNDDQPLMDDTGNRRFLPIRVEREIDLQWLDANLEQLIGEACRLETADAPLSLPREVWTTAATHQEGARAEARWELILEAALGTQEGYLTAADLVAFLERATRNPPTPQQAGVVMKRLGFERLVMSIRGEKYRAWRRGEGRAFRYFLASNGVGPPVLMRAIEGPGPVPEPPAPEPR